MPVSPGSFEYQFSPGALKQVRDKLGLSQTKLAARLDLPVNTISRWERGETTPDANSLAAIYSIAKERGLEPEFFQKGVGMVSSTKSRQESQKPLGGRVVLNRQRTRLVVIWDYQNVALEADAAYDTWFYMEKFVDIAFPNTMDNWVFKVYASGEHRQSVSSLRHCEVSTSYGNADYQIKQDTRRLCGFQPFGWPAVAPKDTVLVLVSKDGDFAELISEAEQAGVDVYLWAPPGCSQDLRGAVKKANIIPWTHPCITVSEENLKRLSR